MMEMIIFMVCFCVGMIYIAAMHEIDNFIKEKFNKLENKVVDLEKEKWLM